MNTEELTKWHDEEFRPRYANMLITPVRTKWGPGGNGKSLAKILRMKPSKELREKIISAIIEQTRHRQKLCDKLGRDRYLTHTGGLASTGNGDLYKNRLIPTWLNDMGWLDEIPSLMDVEQRGTNKKFCSCGSETMPGHYQCQPCYERNGLTLVK